MPRIVIPSTTIIIWSSIEKYRIDKKICIFDSNRILLKKKKKWNETHIKETSKLSSTIRCVQMSVIHTKRFFLCSRKKNPAASSLNRWIALRFSLRLLFWTALFSSAASSRIAHIMKSLFWTVKRSSEVCTVRNRCGMCIGLSVPYTIIAFLTNHKNILLSSVEHRERKEENTDRSDG